MIRLDELIPIYAENKQELDSYKKLCDRQNAEIKTIMQNAEITEYDCGTHKAKISVQNRQTLNEDMLLSKIKELDRRDLVETKEYVNMDLLEKAMYNGEISPETLESCMVNKEVITLKVSVNK